MELSSIYVKFGHASPSEKAQSYRLAMHFDLGENEPILEIDVHGEFPKDLDAPLSGLRERAKDGSLELLREAVRLLEQYSLAELDQQVDDRDKREAANLEGYLRGDRESP